MVNRYGVDCSKRSPFYGRRGCTTSSGLHIWLYMDHCCEGPGGKILAEEILASILKGSR